MNLSCEPEPEALVHLLRLHDGVHQLPHEVQAQVAVLEQRPAALHHTQIKRYITREQNDKPHAKKRYITRQKRYITRKENDTSHGKKTIPHTRTKRYITRKQNDASHENDDDGDHAHDGDDEPGDDDSLGFAPTICMNWLSSFLAWTSWPCPMEIARQSEEG